MPKPFRIALTGGLASGKSTIANLFSENDVPIIDTDTISRKIVAQGKPALEKIIAEFGKQVISDKGELDRQKLKEIIFGAPQAKTKLEEILHPLIFQEIENQLSRISFPYCIVVIPLLIETGTMSQFDHILLVDIPEEIQMKRAMKRDNSSKQLIQSIINSQTKRNERIKHADDIIDNTVKIKELGKIVNSLHKKYLNLSQQHNKTTIN